MREAGRRLNFANVTSVIALFVALGGTAFAAATIGSNDIKRNAVLSKHIKKGNVKTADIANNAVNSGKVAAGSLGGNDIGDGSLGAADLGNNAVGSGEIAAGAVTAGKLGVTPTWTNLTLAGDWATYSGTNTIGFGPLQCYKDPFGIVHLRGAVEQVAPSPNQPIALLPAACSVFGAGASPTVAAEFAGVTLDDAAFGVGGAALWVATDGTDNIVGADTPAPGVGKGFAFDGAAIGSR